jgi:AcrR family transcriptional regulator
VYQYFSGREQLVTAAAEQIAQRFAFVSNKVLRDSKEAPLSEFASVVLRPIVAFWGECPAVLHLLDRMQSAVPSPQRELHATLRRFVSPLVAQVTIEMIRATLLTLARTPVNKRAPLMREFEHAIAAYLQAKAAT